MLAPTPSTTQTTAERQRASTGTTTKGNNEHQRRHRQHQQNTTTKDNSNKIQHQHHHQPKTTKDKRPILRDLPPQTLIQCRCPSGENESPSTRCVFIRQWRTSPSQHRRCCFQPERSPPRRIRAVSRFLTPAFRPCRSRGLSADVRREA